MERDREEKRTRWLSKEKGIWREQKWCRRVFVVFVGLGEIAGCEVRVAAAPEDLCKLNMARVVPNPVLADTLLWHQRRAAGDAPTSLNRQRQRTPRLLGMERMLGRRFRPPTLQKKSFSFHFHFWFLKYRILWFSRDSLSQRSNSFSNELPCLKTQLAQIYFTNNIASERERCARMWEKDSCVCERKERGRAGGPGPGVSGKHKTEGCITTTTQERTVVHFGTRGRSTPRHLGEAGSIHPSVHLTSVIAFAGLSLRIVCSLRRSW